MTPSFETALVRVAPAGDAALVAEFPPRIDPRINDQCRAAAAELRSRWAAILRDVVIGYCTVTVYFDPLRVDSRWLESEIRTAAVTAEDAGPDAGAVIPGGWNIIGRTPVKPYDPARLEPFLFKAGDRVQFTPVSRADFERVS